MNSPNNVTALFAQQNDEWNAFGVNSMSCEILRHKSGAFKGSLWCDLEGELYNSASHCKVKRLATFCFDSLPRPLARKKSNESFQNVTRRSVYWAWHRRTLYPELSKRFLRVAVCFSPCPLLSAVSSQAFCVIPTIKKSKWQKALCSREVCWQATRCVGNLTGYEHSRGNAANAKITVVG